MTTGTKLNLRDLTRPTNVKAVLSGKAGFALTIVELLIVIALGVALAAIAIGANIFLVPGMQNDAATADLKSIHSAEQVYYGNAVPPRYGTPARLVETKSMLKSENKHVVITLGGDGQSFCVASKSQTDKVFWMTSESSDVTGDTARDARQAEPPVLSDSGAEAAVCATVADVKQAIDDKTAGIK